MSDEVVKEEMSQEQVTTEVAEQKTEALEEAQTTPTAQTADTEVQAALVEALILAHGTELSGERIKQIAQLSDEDLLQAVAAIKNRCANDACGFDLIEVNGNFQFRTKAQFASFVRELKSEAPRRLTPAALETLAIIAYRQPIVRSDIEKIRGVDVTPTIKTLLERSLIKIVGHQSSVGQPALYGTTDEFLSLFNMKSLGELPSLRDLRELERDPGESEEVETHAETAPVETTEAPATH